LEIGLTGSVAHQVVDHATNRQAVALIPNAQKAVSPRGHDRASGVADDTLAGALDGVSLWASFFLSHRSILAGIFPLLCAVRFTYEDGLPDPPIDP
jgi:hypothetical protein